MISICILGQLSCLATNIITLHTQIFPLSKNTERLKIDNCLRLKRNMTAKQRIKFDATFNCRRQKNLILYAHKRKSNRRFLTKTNKLDGFMNQVNSSIFSTITTVHSVPPYTQFVSSMSCKMCHL